MYPTRTATPDIYMVDLSERAKDAPDVQPGTRDHRRLVARWGVVGVHRIGARRAAVAES